jgi:hypothetical protein
VVKMQYDAPKHTRDEATELCVYHLRMAASLFQLVPDDENQSLFEEINRQNAEGIVAVDIEPARAWADVILDGYNKMKERD